MNERRRPPRRGRGTRPYNRPPAENGAEDNPYREGPAETVAEPSPNPPSTKDLMPVVRPIDESVRPIPDIPDSCNP